MKPKNWDVMPHSKKLDYAEGLIATPRGKYLLAQALHYGIKTLKSVEPPIMRERSNIEDMEMLSVLFEPLMSLFSLPRDYDAKVALLDKIAPAQKGDANSR